MENAPTSKGWRNPAVIAAIIGAIAAILVAVIGLMPKIKSEETTRIEQQTPGNTPKVEASSGVAAGRDIRDSTITVNGPDRETATRDKPKGN
jgi:hypothetical protein